MNFDPMKPIWLQVLTRLKQDIATGALPPGAKLPGGRDLAVSFGINPNTAARIYQEMEREGLCETRRGLGTFVTADMEKIRRMKTEMARSSAERFLREISGLGIGLEAAIQLIREVEEDTHAEK